MPVRPVDRDVLSDICGEIAQDNCGFLYVDRAKDRIQSEYESADKSMLKAGSVTASSIEETLSDLAADDAFEFERLRPRAYYISPFGGGGLEKQIMSTLTTLFRTQMVVTAEAIRDAFDIAHDDLAFFTRELRNRRFVMRIAAGNREYFTVGGYLEEETDEPGLTDKLETKSFSGKISHEQLEDAIAVSATSDVINYLQSEGYIVDLDGEYLVCSALDEFTRGVTKEISDDVVEAFEDAGYAMPRDEYDSLVETRVTDVSSVLDASRTVHDDTLSETRVLNSVRENLESGYDIRVRDGVAVHADPLSEVVEDYASDLVRQSMANGGAATPSSVMEDVDAELDELHLASTEAGNAHVRDQIREAAAERANAAFETE
ncbi:hypothetical protein SAMN04487947_1639 [Halogeometricum rufum]|jgi:hypothetical protein|uniref:Uncharacterized protein n=1 Tax=Halogeometricum rufum TaxID=553469 RepID=A0A1I6GTL5_9EURY|nr:hypothetical protein [Halogeometricum rufum]SFR45552.1 hypothetical protein SAMN04487947_1639 [Halogeometricum rufum]